MRSLLAFTTGLSAGIGIAILQYRDRRASERLGAAALETLLNAIDANDAETGAHVRRVAVYASILADALGLDEHRRRAVERAALFHDIGKIHGALFDILHEDDELTAEERRAIASHPRRGAEVLEPLRAFYPDLPDCVLSHHERWDGGGYPRRLRGRRIPLAARIVTLTDTFDVMTHGRRYQQGRSVSDVALEIAAGRGRQFDPELVDLLLLPPVLQQLREAHRGHARPARRAERRSGETQSAPDLSFRWRPEASGRPAQDQAR